MLVNLNFKSRINTIKQFLKTRDYFNNWLITDPIIKLLVTLLIEIKFADANY